MHFLKQIISHKCKFSPKKCSKKERDAYFRKKVFFVGESHSNSDPKHGSQEMRERKREKRGGKGWLGWLVGGYLGLEEEEEEEEGVKAVVVSPFPPFLALLFSPSLKPPPPPATNEREVRSRRRQFLFFSSNPPTNIFFLSGGGSDASSYSGSIFCLPKVWGERGLFLGLHFQVYNKNYSALFPGPGKRGGIQYIFWTKIIWDSFFLKGSLVGF